jgi:hypothetical protein
VTDDIASAPPTEQHRRRGIAGSLAVFKAAGWACDSGASLDEVVRIASKANQRVRTLGVAFSGCTLPGPRAGARRGLEGRADALRRFQAGSEDIRARPWENRSMSTFARVALATLCLSVSTPAIGPEARAATPPPRDESTVQASPARAPRPAPAELASTDAALDKLLKQRIAAARKPADKSSLARELAAMAREAGSDEAIRWSLLRRGLQLAASAGDERLHEQLLDEQLARFDLPEPRARLDQWRAFAEAAKGLKDRSLSARVEARLAELTEELAQAERLAPSREALARDAADPAANLVVGRHECFTEREWARGLQRLSRGADPALGDLATRDLASPVDPAARIALGRAWLEFGARQKEPACSASSERGRMWLGRAWPRASGDERQDILTELRAIWLQRADAAKERLDGRWTETAELPVREGLSTARVLATPDRRMLLTTHWGWDAEQQRTRTEDVRAAFWRLPEGKLLVEWEHGIDNPWHLAFSQDGNLLLATGAVSAKAVLAVHAAPSGERLWRLDDAGSHLVRPGFGPGDRTLVVPRDNGHGTIAWVSFDLATGRDLGILVDNVDAASAVVGPDGRWIFALEREPADGRGVLVLRDTRTGAVANRMHDSIADSQIVQHLVFAGSTWAMTGAGPRNAAKPADGTGGIVILWDLLAGVELARSSCAHPEVSLLKPSPSASWAMVHSTKYTPLPDGASLATTSTELVNLAGGRRLPLPSHWKAENPSWQLEFLGGGLVVGTDEKQRVKFWTISAR